MTQRQLGFVGLGLMGGGMVKSLRRAGFPVAAYDLKTQLIQAAVANDGATAGTSPKDVAARSEVVLSSLPDPAAVEAAALGPDGIIEGIRPGSTYIDLSSIDPTTSRKVHAAMAEKGARMLDCPVGMGPKQAAEGKLALMVGGEAALIEELKDVLDALGSSIHHCGPAGSGAAAKLINNLVSCSINTLNAEAMVMAAKAGVDLEVMCEIMLSTAAANRHLEMTTKARVLEGDFSPNFKLFLAHKDLGLACRMALEMGVPTPIGAAARFVHDAAMGEGRADEDQSAVIKIAEQAAGVEARRKR